MQNQRLGKILRGKARIKKKEDKKRGVKETWKGSNMRKDNKRWERKGKRELCKWKSKLEEKK